MNALNAKTAALGLFILAGMALITIGFTLFNGDAREAFLYLGSGTAAMSLVLLLMKLYPPQEFKKVAVRHEEADTFLGRPEYWRVRRND